MANRIVRVLREDAVFAWTAGLSSFGYTLLGTGNDLLNHFSGPFACSVGRQLADQRSDSRLRPDVGVIDLLFSSPLA